MCTLTEWRKMTFLDSTYTMLAETTTAVDSLSGQIWSAAAGAVAGFIALVGASIVKQRRKSKNTDDPSHVGTPIPEAAFRDCSQHVATSLQSVTDMQRSHHEMVREQWTEQRAAMQRMAEAVTKMATAQEENQKMQATLVAILAKR